MLADIASKLIAAIRSSSVFNQDVQVAPACILWPDRERQWEAVIPRLQQELPELFVLGDYNPEKKIGPAIWLRCVIGGALDDIQLPKKNTPIFYLPGVGRQDLRAVQNCPDHLKPLAELQYRGTIWSQLNSKDWTILAFLRSDQGGLGLDVAQNNESKNAMQVSLHHLLDEDVELLKGRRLDKDYFNTLLRVRSKITSHFSIPASGHLSSILNHEILDVALLRLRFRSIGSTKYDPNPGANSAKLFLSEPLVAILSVTFYNGLTRRRKSSEMSANRVGLS